MLKNRLSALDASFLSLESEDSNMCVGGADVFAGPAPDQDEVLDELERRLDAVPDFRLRRVQVPFGLGRARWADAEDFRLEDHVTRVVLPEPGSAERVQDVFAQMMAEPVDHSRPPWEIRVVEGLEGGRFALLHKMHHALVDGIASVQVLETLFSHDPAGDDPAQSRQADPKPAPSPVRMLAESAVERTLAPETLGAVAGVVTHPRRTAGSVLRGAAGLAGLARAVLRPAPDTPYNQPVGPDRSFAWQRESLDVVKEVKDALGGSVNDVVLTAVAGALDRDLRRRGGHPGHDELFAFVPVSLRADAGDGLGNEVSGLKVALPVGENDPLERFARVHQTMDALKDSPQALGARAAIDATGLVSPAAFEAASPVGDVQRYANLVITNVPGPADKLYFLGRELEDVFPFVPLGGNMAMGVAVVSYAGTLGFGFSADPASVPDVHELAVALRESLAELAEAARAAAPQ